MCRIMEGLSAEIGVMDLASGSTIWQLNWVEVAWPESLEILTKDGRIFFKTILRDGSGSTATAWVQERAALQLSH